MGPRSLPFRRLPLGGCAAGYFLFMDSCAWHPGISGSGPAALQPAQQLLAIPPARPPACPPRLPAAPAGYAYVGGTRSIFQGVYPRDPSALLHEMGHSLGLWHASIIPSERPLWAPCGDAPLLCSHAHHSHALVPGMSTMLLQVAWQPRQSRQQLPNEA
jgi:hypothetical protein